MLHFVSENAVFGGLRLVQLQVNAKREPGGFPFCMVFFNQCLRLSQASPNL